MIRKTSPLRPSLHHSQAQRRKRVLQRWYLLHQRQHREWLMLNPLNQQQNNLLPMPVLWKELSTQ
jgi:hypothetical protein